jgi:hypothetical protein
LTFGATLWLAYAVVESWMLGIVPWLRQPAHTYRPLHIGMTVLLFVVYPLAGMISGAVAARLFADDVLRRAVVIVFLAIVYAVNALLLLSSSSELTIPLVSSGIVAVAAVIAARLPGARSLRWALNPWCAVLLLAGLPWVTKDLLPLASRPVKLGAAIAWLIVVPAATAIVRRREPGPAVRSRATWAVATVTLLLTVVLRDGPRIAATPGAPAAAAAIRSIDRRDLDGHRPRGPSVGIRLHGGYHAGAHSAGVPRHSLRARDVDRGHDPGVARVDVHRSIPSQHGFAQRPHMAGASPARSWHSDTCRASCRVGYKTMGVVANFGNLGTSLGLDRGFQYYDPRAAVRFLLDDPARNHFLRQGANRVLQRLTGTDLAEVPYRRAADINRAVLPLLDEVAANPQPFFLFVNYMDAHWPYRPPPPFDTKFGSTRARSIAMADYYRMASDVMAGRRTLTDTERADLHAQYDGGIANIDQQIGALVDRLEKLERLDNCLLIVTADHGEAFGEHALVEHGVSVYGDQIHVPLIVKYPRQRTPSRVRDAVSGVDVMATALEAAGQAVPADVEGRSLPRGGENSASPRVVFSESHPGPGLFERYPRFRRVERAIVSDGLKLIVSTAGKRELYDLDEDPEDARDLAPARPDVAQRLDQAVNRWLATVKPSDDGIRTLDPKTLERLKSLGYIR